MNLQTFVDGALVLVLLLDLVLLGASRLFTCVRIFGFQCLVLAALPVCAELIHGATPGVHAIGLGLATIAAKGIFIPWLLIRVIRSGEIHREVEPFLGFTTSMVLGALLVVGSFVFSRRFPATEHPLSTLLMPVALSTLFTGLLVLVTRLKAVTQVLGYLVVENGIFLVGLLLVRQTPLLVELGILLDVFVGVFIMAIVVYHIRKEFDHMDTNLLTELKEN